MRSIRRDRDAGIAAIDSREVTHTTAAVGERIGGTQDRVTVIAKNGVEQPFLRRRTVGQAECRCEVVHVRLVRVGVLRQVLILRNLARHCARLEQVSNSRHAPNISDGRGRVAVVPRHERELVLVAEAHIDRQVVAGAPLILNEAAELVQLTTLDARRQVHILAAVFVEPGIRVDRADPPRQHRIQRPGISEVRARGVREVRGVEHGIRGVTRRDAEVDLRDHVLVIGPQSDVGKRTADTEVVRTLQPRQRVADIDRRIHALLRRTAGRRRRDVVVVGRCECANVQREPCLIADGHT